MSFSSSLKDALWSLRKNRTATITVLAILILGVVALAGYMLFGGGGPIVNRVVNLGGNVNTGVDSVPMTRRIIDGVSVPITRANAFPVAVVVEDLVASRPQAGLDRANVVYEMLAEGGITRFLALYASAENIEKIGPVRSSRTPHLDIVKEYDALYAHAGGSPDALNKIPSYGIRDLNQFTNSQYYWRDAERRKTKALEHTLYTSSELLARAIRDKKMPDVGEYDGWQFADDLPVSQRPTTPKTITIEFSTFNYKVDYTYDPASNLYTRKLGEQPHVMEDGATIRTKNVIVQYVPTTLADDEGRLSMEFIGEGEAVVFHDGQAVNATWKKSSRTGRTQYFGADGRELTFTAGTIWVEIVPNDRDVSYT